jgi:hypothetical protein
MGSGQHRGAGLSRRLSEAVACSSGRRFSAARSAAVSALATLATVVLLALPAQASARFTGFVAAPPAIGGIGPEPVGVQGPGGQLEGRRVGCGKELADVLRSGYTGRVIVAESANAVPPCTTVGFKLDGLDPIPLRSGVQLVGERGVLGGRPVLYTTQKTPKRAVFEVQGNDVQVVGLHFRGPTPAKDHTQHISDENPYVHAIRVLTDSETGLSGRRITIADNEFDNWSGAGVQVSPMQGDHNATLEVWKQHGPGSDTPWKPLSRLDAGQVRVIGNYMHHNVMDGGGYGVNVDGGSYALIEGNVFDFNRHSIASDGMAHGGYIARFNYVLQGGYKQQSDFAPDYYNQHFDVHGDGNGDGSGYGGWAGEYFSIENNTIRGEQKYGIPGFRATRPAFMLRGRAAMVAFFNNNILVHDDLDTAVSLKKKSASTGIGENQTDFNFRASGNLFDTDHSTDIAAGDFDGDGRSDVFVATGTAWFYSRGGVRPWEYLTSSGRQLRELGFADIDNDRLTDVLWRDAKGTVGYSRAARVPWVPLTPVPVPMNELRFGDFDGDGRTDMFYTRGGQWNIWYGSTRTWTKTQTSSKPISELLFGNFDDRAGIDVAGVNSNGWAYSSGATRAWVRMNGRLTRSFKDAVAADFDGNGKTDIAVDEGSRWRYSRDGRASLAVLLPNRGGPGPPGPLKKMVIGRFDSRPMVGLVTFGPLKRRGEVAQYDDRLVVWDAQVCCFGVLSQQDMR